ncbi:hypothetical protein SAY86_006154 [Trapa natans]|uniref:Phytocyanin domain-containing protein n=1 Tax=Trapa natans TaxID=22666 RepID=A0AAN7LCQ9_TRANT|nr:hypothetical protein SAY86_006154 [Trapa natans]
MEINGAVKTVMVVVITSMVLVVSATNHTVGGISGWDLTSDIGSWSAKTSFHDGDFLVFNYTPVHDVLEVNATEFTACKTINPIGVYTDGETVIPLSEPGTTRYFICGRSDHCSRGLKLRVRIHQKVTGSTAARGDKGKEQNPSRRRRHPLPPPIRSHCNDDNDSSGSGASRGKLDWMQRCLFSVVFPAVAQVILRLSL